MMSTVLPYLTPKRNNPVLKHEEMEELSGITMTRLSCSVHDDRYIVMSKDNHMEANRLTVELLEALQKAATEDEGIDTFMKEHHGEGFTAQQIKRLLAEKIMPRLMKTGKRKKPFLYQRQLLNQEQIDAFSDRLSPLFNKYLMCGVFVSTVVLDTFFFSSTENLLEFANTTNAFTIVALLVFIVASSLFHELGHAAACKRFGVEHGGIGFGLYINFPVLYTDVTNVWRLPRRKRLVVNIAGVYFQCIILIVLFAGSLATGNDLLRYMILTMNFGFLLTLNPFFRFDGYWIATDMLGVPNLRKRSTELLKYLFSRMTGKPAADKPYLLQIRRREQMLGILYALTVNIFMGFYFFYVIPVFLYDFIGSFPQEVEQLVLCMANNITPPFALLRNMFSQSLFFALIIFMMYRMLLPFVRKRMNKE